jgi:hypothetical protein
MTSITVVWYSTEEERKEGNRENAKYVGSARSPLELSTLANTVVDDGGFPDYFEGDEHLDLYEAQKRLGAIEIRAGLVPVLIYPGDLTSL